MNDLLNNKIRKMIYVIRGQKVMLDSDLAELYGVETKVLNQAVKRNIDRFPLDFLFQLTKEESQNQRSQIVTFDNPLKTRKYLPYVFTENGVAMLSSVLNSSTAIQINITIMRIFTRLRSFYMMERQLADKVNNLEANTNKMFKVVFERLDDHEEIITPKISPNRKKIGFSSKN